MKITDSLYWTGIGGVLALSAFLFLREHEQARTIRAVQKTPQTIEQKVQEVNYKDNSVEYITNSPELSNKTIPKKENTNLGIVYNTEDFTTDSQQILLARVLYGEARSESRATKEAIASTILNRTKKHVWWGKSNYSNFSDYSLHAIVLKPSQYSCFNSNDPNLVQLKNPHGNAWQECLAVSKDVLDGKVKDSTSGSTHYHNARNAPFWAEGKTPKLILPTNIGGDFKFYELER